MATNTINYNLIMPDLNETADIAVLNSNMPVIDGILKANENVIDDVANDVSNLEGIVNTNISESAAQIALKGNTTDINNLLALKVDKVSGKGLSTNDYDNVAKAEVAKVVNKANITDVNSSLSLKVDKINGKGLSTNDYDTLEKEEVAKVKNKLDKATFDAYGSINAIGNSIVIPVGYTNQVVYTTNATAIVLTIPINTFPVGTQITFIQLAGGTVTFAPSSGVTLLSKDTKRTIDGLYASATLIKLSTDTWSLIGALV